MTCDLVHPANVADRDGTDWAPEAVKEKSTRLRHIWSDSGYTSELVEWWQDEQGITIEIVGNQPGQRTFMVVPRRWVVERTFAIFSMRRCLAVHPHRLRGETHL